MPLRDGRRFALVDPGGITHPTGAYAQAADPGHDDSAWREVAVPHDWSIEQTPTPTTDHGTTSGTGFLPGGLGWYRLAFTLPPAHAGKRISAEFDGAYSPVSCTPAAARPTCSRSRCRTSCRAATGTPAAASTARPGS
ncbi:glycosyl hydrolase family 2 [Streptomyces puniciscabiei]|uniref:Glycosyl hydrolase family 2 n=1 Tax=Streptomyces puniciscabiei TaxID=164348 RepID=A0A542SXU9_9ACTN|nr:glycosyl hydrolase family 2 [Streptomyces puniciscabiei]